ncbi:MAG: substrate-binding domain-containing protein [bacterium]|nr:substrate-binding domain-containing protein [bacterium]
MATTGKRGMCLAAILCVLTVLAAACGGGSGAGSAFGLAERPDSSPDSPDPGESTDAGAPTAGEGGAQVLTDVSGPVTISGSSTVEPISVRVAELFRDVAPNVSVTVDGPGTGDGFKLFCAGETDISDASRRIKDTEAEACAEAGIEWIELRVGIDGIAVLTNPENDAVDCLSFEDLYAIVGPESVGFTNWRDAGALAAELGSSTSFPDLALDITAPGAESGTYDSFIEIVLEHIGEARAEAGAVSEDEAATTRPDYVSAGDDNVIIQGIDGSRGSFGWVGFAFTGDADVKLLEIDDGDGCVAPTPGTIAAGEYPVSRSLYIYVNSARAAASTAVRAYVDFYVSETGLGRAVSDVGYVVLTDDAQATTVADWHRRRIGR